MAEPYQKKYEVRIDFVEWDETVPLTRAELFQLFLLLNEKPDPTSGKEGDDD